ncbi:MAG: general stress protein [Labedaea sp.]
MTATNEGTNGRSRSMPAGVPERRAVASYLSYGEAERAVDFLSDHDFPVARVAIIGHEVRLVEQVIGRLNWGRSALHGAGSGALVGGLTGWVFGLFDWVRPLVASLTLAAYGLIIGALLGAVFAVVVYAFQGGRRDFASVQALQPSRYDIVVDGEVADKAARLLARREGAHAASVTN